MGKLLNINYIYDFSKKIYWDIFKNIKGIVDLYLY
jgi:hypothetical protein